MPKVTGTCRQKAQELLARLIRGPSLSNFDSDYSPERAERDVHLWLNSWIIPVVRELVPELREKNHETK